MAELILHHTKTDVTINGQAGKKLDTVQTSGDPEAHGAGYSGGTVTWRANISIRHSNGSETSLGTDVASVSRSADGEGYQNAGFTLNNNVSVVSTDAIKVVEKLIIGANTYTRTWISAQLGFDGVLSAATWDFIRWTFADAAEWGEAELTYGNSTRDSRIEGIIYQESSAQDQTINGSGGFVLGGSGTMTGTPAGQAQDQTINGSGGFVLGGSGTMTGTPYSEPSISPELAAKIETIYVLMTHKFARISVTPEGIEIWAAFDANGEYPVMTYEYNPATKVRSKVVIVE
ncbi:MAG: hypothetical protein QY316_00490 [Thermodesulfobacteriota bacterium]|nr:MAG: hypothetical protein QY316_00490 [Thermodesulfobacteriota bacterium]